MQLGPFIKHKRKRKGWSQTVLGDVVGMSAASIHRIEHGEKIPPDHELQLFAKALDTDIIQLIQKAEHDQELQKDQGLPENAYQAHWTYAHPADYSGRVWIDVQLSSKMINSLTIHIQWGAWEYKDVIDTSTNKRIVLWHYKFNDGLGLPIIVNLSAPCYVVFGKDPPPKTITLDIINQWKRIEPMSIRQRLRHTFNFVSVYIQWHLAQGTKSKSE